jgi:hypothetical protein
MQGENPESAFRRTQKKKQFQPSLVELEMPLDYLRQADLESICYPARKSPSSQEQGERSPG